MEMAGKQGGWAVPRQAGALPAGTALPDAPAVIGVSAFAFQGTNAHALMAAPPAGASIVKPAADWARQRFWVAPRHHAGKPRSCNAAAMHSSEVVTPQHSCRPIHNVP